MVARMAGERGVGSLIMRQPEKREKKEKRHERPENDQGIVTGETGKQASQTKIGGKKKGKRNRGRLGPSQRGWKRMSRYISKKKTQQKKGQKEGS